MEKITSFQDVKNNYPDYLNDESGLITDGHADQIFFPKSILEIQQILYQANKLRIPVTVSGAGTGLSGGRVPHGGWIIATNQITRLDEVARNKNHWQDPETIIQYEYILDEISHTEAEVTIPISMTLRSLQGLLKQLNWFYPPDPTERSAFIGGNVATNASGSRSFKYGATREWTKKLLVLLGDGSLIKLSREINNLNSTENSFKIKNQSKTEIVPKPTYNLPNTKKNVAGPVVTKESQAIDLFIGSGGIFGIICQVTLKLIKPPKDQVSIFVYLETKDQMFKLIKLCQTQRELNKDPLPMSVEYLGPNAVSIIKNNDDTTNENISHLIILEQDSYSEEDLFNSLDFWTRQFESLGIKSTSVAQTFAEIEHHKFLRHKVPETINSIVRSFGQPKLGTDYSVPIAKTQDFFNYASQIGEEFRKYQNRAEVNPNPSYAIWAHAGDAHIHLNLIPRTEEETKFGKSLFDKMMKQIVEWGGSIAAEHGIGKKKFGDQFPIEIQYGLKAIEEIKLIKSILDPHFILNRGNLIGYDSDE